VCFAHRKKYPLDRVTRLAEQRNWHSVSTRNVAGLPELRFLKPDSDLPFDKSVVPIIYAIENFYQAFFSRIRKSSGLSRVNKTLFHPTTESFCTSQHSHVPWSMQICIITEAIA
jgi:hypothetical protein